MGAPSVQGSDTHNAAHRTLSELGWTHADRARLVACWEMLMCAEGALSYSCSFARFIHVRPRQQACEWMGSS
jgi:hypothetical protein